MRSSKMFVAAIATFSAAIAEVQAHPGTAESHSSIDGFLHHLISSDSLLLGAITCSVVLAVISLRFFSRRQRIRRRDEIRRDPYTVTMIRGFDPFVDHQ